jgi:holo-[acyl-carrier protein] synthase
MSIDDLPAARVLGLGHDVVDVQAFGEQLDMPGSTFMALFSVRERRQCAMRAQLKGDGEACHLAARWAGKEAVIKAWDEALGELPAPYDVESIPWSRIEILDDSRGRPHVVLSDGVERRLHESLGCGSGSGDDGRIAGQADIVWHLSLSHDGPIASAVALCCRNA